MPVEAVEGYAQQRDLITAAQTSKSAADYQAYLAAYPQGLFAALAQSELALIALAPFLSLPLAARLVVWRVQNGHGIVLADLGYWFLLGEMLIAAWPSPTDYRQAIRSWPVAAVIGAIFYVWP